MYKLFTGRVSAAAGMMLLVAGLYACNNNPQSGQQYCDSTGCYQCSTAGTNCYPVPGTPTGPSVGGVTACANDSSCPSGQVCNLGDCQTECKADSDCISGDTCINGRCRPQGSAQCGTAGAFCTASSQCGTNRTCVTGACGNDCTGNSNCATGQTCQSGVCLEDPSPVAAQCQFDYDCGAQGGYRCVNAYCLQKCTANSQCPSSDVGATCVMGLCRADRRAAS